MCIRDSTRLEQRLLDVTDRAKRGAEVGGLLAPLEHDAAGTERDLIVGAGQRIEDARDAERAERQREELLARGAAVGDLVTRVVSLVTPAPRFGVPDVRALGDVPTDPSAVDAYPVSYTHLDVYKRQALWLGLQQGRRRLREVRQRGAGATAHQRSVEVHLRHLARRTARPGSDSARGGLRTVTA